MRIFHFLQADTSRVMWSWHSGDPASPDSIMKHEYKGSKSINLLGGLVNAPSQLSDPDSFIIGNNVSCSVCIHVIGANVSELPLVDSTVALSRYIGVCTYRTVGRRTFWPPSGPALAGRIVVWFPDPNTFCKFQP